MAQHTPGPWILDEDDLSITAEVGAHICNVTDVFNFPRVEDEELDRVADECLANARLIAAAPDLLAALRWAAGMAEEAIRIREAGDDPEDTPQVIALHREGLTSAHAALAKAA